MTEILFCPRLFSDERYRQASFSSWQGNTAVDTQILAKAGFYCSGPGETKCFKCGMTVSNWQPEDQPFVKHCQESPNCPLALETLIRHNGISESDLERYKIRQCRLESFANWPSSAPVLPSDLAAAGFYYLKVNQMVACIYCKGVISNWNPGDHPHTVHRIKFPDCNFHLIFFAEEVVPVVLNVNNERLLNNTSTLLDQAEVQSQLNTNNEELLHDGDIQSEQSETQSQLNVHNERLLHNTATQLEQLGIQSHVRPVQPDFATYECRLKTFENWPKNLNQTPQMLAEAGFIYIGQQDCVRCFHCDGGLVNWEADDDVWVEHARWFPKCGYVLMVQGQQFIKQCIETRQPSETSLEPEQATNLLPTPIGSPLTRTHFLFTPNAASTSQNKERTNSKMDSLMNSAQKMIVLKTRSKSKVSKETDQVGSGSNDVPSANVCQVKHLQNQNRQDDIESQLLTPSTSSSDTVNNKQQTQNSIAINSEEKILHSLQDLQLVNDATKSGITDDKDKENDIERKEQKRKSVDCASLLEEIRRLKESRLCKICMDCEMTVVLLPCGHLVTCAYCISSFMHCPICREKIRATVRTFLS